MDERGFSTAEISALIKDEGYSLQQIVEEGFRPQDPVRRLPAVCATDVKVEKVRFLWWPYLPIGDYTVMMAEGGVGKTIACAGIAAAVSNGNRLPGDTGSHYPRNVLFISAEDSNSVLRERCEASGAELSRIFFIDFTTSDDLSLSTDYELFINTIKAKAPALVVIDPWHAFLGADVDINRVNATRPVFQKVAKAAKECDCSIILVSHVNKRAQGENVNNAATGSSDFINAARSAIRVIVDETEDDTRILVHTKSNYAPLGQSVKYIIDNGGVEWAGFSPINKIMLEAAARKRATPWELMKINEETAATNSALIEALKTSAGVYAPKRYSYDAFKKLHGDLIFGGSQPKKVIDAIKTDLHDRGYFIDTCNVKENGRSVRGFLIQRIEDSEPEQLVDDF